MTREEAIEILALNNSFLSDQIKKLEVAGVEIPVGDAKANAYHVIDYCKKKHQAVEMAISTLRAQQEHTCPCDLRNFGPPSGMRGKPCTMCPAVPRQERNDPLTLDEIREAAETGDPVWLVGMEDGDGWVRIDGVYSLTIGYSRFGDTETWCFRKASYGVRVWAYRQKPEESCNG